MDEYISREATVKAFCEKCKGYYDGHCVHRVNVILMLYKPHLPQTYSLLIGG